MKANVVQFPASGESAPETKTAPREIDFDFSLDLPTKVQVAMEDMDKRGIRYNRNGSYHLQVDNVNFYPTSGKVMLNGQVAFKTNGYDFFLAVLRREGLYRD